MNFVKVGKFRKPHGLNGAIKVQIEDRYLEDVLQAKSIFVVEGGGYLPYFVEDIQLGNDTLLHLEEMQSRSDVMHLTNQSIALREEDLLSDDQRTFEYETLEYAFLRTYQLKDVELGPVGEITEVLDMPQQEMALVAFNEQEVLIPLHPDLIVDINQEEKVLTMDLPEGLLPD